MSEMSIYEKKFAKSEDTDAILVVEGKKLHVNKGFLSIHSPYFKALFNSGFKEKSMDEIPIEDVNFEDFVRLLTLIHPEPARLTVLTMYKVTNSYNSVFAASRVNDATLLVEGRKLHVNRTVLSLHSAYFKELFDWGMNQDIFEIDDVQFDELASLLSLVQGDPIIPIKSKIENQLKLADRFEFSDYVKKHLELYLTTAKMPSSQKLILADRHNLNILMEMLLKSTENMDLLVDEEEWKGFTESTKAKLFDRMMTLKYKKNRIEIPVVREETPIDGLFGESEGNDVVLVVEEKRIHLNKAVLSAASDYFSALFHSDFMEKSMNEIKLEDVKYEDLIRVLAILRPTARIPELKISSIDSLLKVTDRFLLLGAKRILELMLMSSDASLELKIRIANQYDMVYLIRNTLGRCPRPDDVIRITAYLELTEKTKTEVFMRQSDLVLRKSRTDY